MDLSTFLSKLHIFVYFDPQLHGILPEKCSYCKKPNVQAQTKTNFLGGLLFSKPSPKDDAHYICTQCNQVYHLHCKKLLVATECSFWHTCHTPYCTLPVNTACPFGMCEEHCRRVGKSVVCGVHLRCVAMADLYQSKRCKAMSDGECPEFKCYFHCKGPCYFHHQMREKAKPTNCKYEPDEEEMPCDNFAVVGCSNSMCGDHCTGCEKHAASKKKSVTKGKKGQSSDTKKSFCNVPNRYCKQDPTTGCPYRQCPEHCYGCTVHAAPPPVQPTPPSGRNELKRSKEFMKTFGGKNVSTKYGLGYMDIFYAARTGNVTKLKEYIEKDKMNPNDVDEHGNTPGYYACLCGQPFALTYLFDHGFTVSLDEPEGERCWLCAHTQAIRDILRNRSTRSKGTNKNKFYRACFDGDLKAMQQFVQTLPGQAVFTINTKNKLGYTPLDIVTLQNHHSKFTAFLKSKGAWSSVITDFKAIVNVKDFADIVILVNNGNERIFAHSVFFMYRLKNWNQIFELVPTDEEKPVHRIYSPIDPAIKALPSEVMIAFMEFLYTGTCWKGKKTLDELLKIATTYKIKPLKVVAENFQGDFKSVVPPAPDFENDMRAAINVPITSDLILLVEDQKFYTHKAILCARSMYFRGMLAGKMLESSLDFIELEDVSITVFQKIMEFMYTGIASNLGSLPSETMLDLLALAGKWLLDPLVSICDNILVTEFAVDKENAEQLFLFAEQHNAPKLKEVAAQFL